MVAEAAVVVGAATAVDVAMTDLVEAEEEEEATLEEADSMPTTSGMEAVEEVTLLLLYNFILIPKFRIRRRRIQ